MFRNRIQQYAGPSADQSLPLAIAEPMRPANFVALPATAGMQMIYRIAYEQALRQIAWQRTLITQRLRAYEWN